MFQNIYFLHICHCTVYILHTICSYMSRAFLLRSGDTKKPTNASLFKQDTHQKNAAKYSGLKLTKQMFLS